MALSQGIPAQIVLTVLAARFAVHAVVLNGIMAIPLHPILNVQFSVGSPTFHATREESDPWSNADRVVVSECFEMGSYESKVVLVSLSLKQ